MMTTTIRLSAEIEERLERLAKKTGRTKSFYIRELVENHLQDLEDYYLAVDALEKVRSGREKTHTSASVRKDLGLED